MRYMAIDYGTARIGVAVSDRTLTISGNSTTVSNGPEAVKKIASICREEEVTNVVVGLPLDSRGLEGPMCENARKFAADLENCFDDCSLRIEFLDERMTTRASESVLVGASMSRKKRKGVIDGLAAKILLQRFLDDFNERAGRVM